MTGTLKSENVKIGGGVVLGETFSCITNYLADVLRGLIALNTDHCGTHCFKSHCAHVPKHWPLFLAALTTAVFPGQILEQNEVKCPRNHWQFGILETHAFLSIHALS